jgi:hypothetical protein
MPDTKKYVYAADAAGFKYSEITRDEFDFITSVTFKFTEDLNEIKESERITVEVTLYTIGTDVGLYSKASPPIDLGSQLYGKDVVTISAFVIKLIETRDLLASKNHKRSPKLLKKLDDLEKELKEIRKARVNAAFV